MRQEGYDVVMIKLLPTLFGTILLAACTTSAAQSAGKEAGVETLAVESQKEDVKVYPRDDHGEVMPFEADKNARAAVDAAIIKAGKTSKDALIVMGANWCHDSRALATHLESPKFKAMLSSHYVLEYIDVGQKNMNQDIARDFGLDGTKGTPTVFIVDETGQVRNLQDAPTWRNAASRSEEEIFKYFRDFAHLRRPEPMLRSTLSADEISSP
jgi:hypothetical protein